MAPEEIEEAGWRPLVRGEVISLVGMMLFYFAVKVAIDLADEHSTARWRLQRVWRNMMRQVSGDEENRAIALAATRGIAYTQVWLARQWANRKDPHGNT